MEGEHIPHSRDMVIERVAVLSTSQNLCSKEEDRKGIDTEKQESGPLRSS